MMHLLRSLFVCRLLVTPSSFRITDSACDVVCRFQPARNAQPIVKFTCTPTEPLSMENLPFDKYELERSPLTQYILSRHQPSHAWQVR